MVHDLLGLHKCIEYILACMEYVATSWQCLTKVRIGARLQAQLRPLGAGRLWRVEKEAGHPSGHRAGQDCNSSSSARGRHAYIFHSATTVYRYQEVRSCARN